MKTNTIDKCHQHKSGLAIPLVLMFCFCVVTLSVSMFYFRKESKQQNITNFQFLQVNYLAQSATQHMLLKLSAFPQDAYDSGVLSMGYCPFRGIPFSPTGAMPPAGNADNTGLQQFFADVNSANPAWLIPDINPNDWRYEIENLEVISAYREAALRRNILTAQLTAIGEGNMERAGMGVRREQMIKTIQLTTTQN